MKRRVIDLWRRMGRWRWSLLGIGVLAVLWAILPLLVREGEVSCKVKPPPGGGTGSDLVVLLHAFEKSSADLEPLRKVVHDRSVLGDADVLACDMPFDTLSMAQPKKVVAQLLTEIDKTWDKRVRAGDPYQRIFFVGHSMGGLFARKAYVVASGESADAPLEPELKAELAPGKRDGRGLVKPRPWADRVERIVLMAGMNRGWSISHHMSIVRAVAMTVGVGVGEILELRFGRGPLIFSIRRGAPFISNLRLQWLAMRHRVERHESEVGGATTVQLLGSIDDLVSPEDNLDLVSGQDFFYLDVKRSGHANVVDMDLSPPPADASAEDVREQRIRNERARVFKLALTAPKPALEVAQTLPIEEERLQCLGPRPSPSSALLDEAGSGEKLASQKREPPVAADPPNPAERPVTDVVFVTHGIRDEGFWTQKIARRVIARAREAGRRVVSETSTYGYFPMLPFLSERARRQKVEWLMDRYTEARACYPGARFHYVGHSNGTYLLAKALEEYPACHFDRVVFAGSVVRTGYPWHLAIERHQVEAVLNFVATGDWVVAIFPKALEELGLQDLGSAGHDGFVDESVVQPEVRHARAYVKGGHGAALDEAFWDAIARFVIDPPEALETFSQSLTTDEELRARFAGERSDLVSFLGRFAPLLWVAILAVLTAILYGLLKLPLREWVRTVIVLAYLALILIVLTRV